jgi:hypothetical protein
MAIDKAAVKLGKRMVNSGEIKKIVIIVENFIKHKKLICYGGTAINNILPKDVQFYNKEFEIPDYDFFTYNALNDAKELADIYYNAGYKEVEAKSGQHDGTYKVFVNFIPIADITQLHKNIFSALKQDAIPVNGILYAPPNFLRMSMYLELSRPAGDTSRWEKVMKRLILLNKYYPITNIDCKKIDFHRKFVDGKTDTDLIYDTVKNTFIEEGVVFFGGYAITLYYHYMPKTIHKQVDNIPDFEVLSNDPLKTAVMVENRLKDVGFKNIKINKKNPIGEIIPLHYEIVNNDDTIAFIYEPVACHSFNTIIINKQKIKIATIDTMLSFYLAFLYANKPYYNNFLERTLCIAKFLFDVQQKNRLSQTGLLRRFTITCYGHQETIEESRANKAKKYKELKNGKKDELQKYFLYYKPTEVKRKTPASNKTKTKKQKNSNIKAKKTHKQKHQT